jgi:hypothetical protein
LASALKSSIADYEDAVLHEAALHVNVDGIVTRDRRAFARGTLPAYSPLEMASLLKSR